MTTENLPPNCFPVTVEGIGDFVFRRRNFRFQGEIERFTSAFRTAPDLLTVMVPFYDLTVLTVLAPPGWDLDDADSFDPLDKDHVVKIVQVWSRMREEEKKIRQRNAAARQPAGAAA